MKDSKIKDRQLLEKAAKDGCTLSLAEIYTKYSPHLSTSLRKIGALETAEDICQAVF